MNYKAKLTSPNPVAIRKGKLKPMRRITITFGNPSPVLFAKQNFSSGRTASMAAVQPKVNALRNFKPFLPMIINMIGPIATAPT